MPKSPYTANKIIPLLNIELFKPHHKPFDLTEHTDFVMRFYKLDNPCQKDLFSNESHDIDLIHILCRGYPLSSSGPARVDQWKPRRCIVGAGQCIMPPINYKQPVQQYKVGEGIFVQHC
jgi:hypothetical protein